MIKSGLVSATLKGFSIEEVLKLLNKANLESIEWSENHHVPLNDKEEVKRISLLTEKAGIVVASYGSYYRLGEDMDFKVHLENAKILKTDKIRVWAGTKASKEVSKEEYEKLVKEAKAISKEAQKSNIKVALEWHKGTLTDENLSGFNFLRDVHEENFRTFWQPTQRLNIEERKEGLKLIEPYLENFHVYYWSDEGRLPLKEGQDIWIDYFSQIDTNKRDYYALLEFVKDNTEEQFLSDSKELLKIIGVVNGRFNS